MMSRTSYILSVEAHEVIAIPFSIIHSITPVTGELYQILQRVSLPHHLQVRGVVTEVRALSSLGIPDLLRGSRLVMLVSERPTALLCSLVIDSWSGEVEKTPYGNFIVYEGRQVKIFCPGDFV